MKKKILNFLFPPLTTVLTVIMFVLFYTGIIDGKPVGFVDALWMTAVVFVVFFIMLDVIIWSVHKPISIISEKCTKDPVERHEDNNESEIIETSVKQDPEQPRKAESSSNLEPIHNECISNIMEYITINPDIDTLFWDAAKFVIEKEAVSIAMLQRYFKIGFNRANRIMDYLISAGIVVFNSEYFGESTISLSDFEHILKDYKSEIKYELSDDAGKSKSYANTMEHPQSNQTDYDNWKMEERISFYNNKIDYMTGEDFEIYCAGILKELGFSNIALTKKSGDHGVDITARLAGISYAIQCKCYSSSVGNSAIQQVHAGKSIHKKDIALVMTNNYFTNQAKKEADLLGVKLWDRDFITGFIEFSEKRKESHEQPHVSDLLKNNTVSPDEYNKVMNECGEACVELFKDLFHMHVEFVRGVNKEEYIELTFDAASIEQAKYATTLTDEIIRFTEYKHAIERIFDNRFIIKFYYNIKIEMV